MADPGNQGRSQTDDSLRAERAKADDALADKWIAIEETADAVIVKARERADQVLAVAREKTDRQTQTSNARTTAAVETRRAREDEAVREERADADAEVRAERAEHAALLTTERSETDKDLLSERARSDDSVATRDEFLGVVSHDLRNLLNSMVGFAALIVGAVPEQNHEEQVLKHAQRIQRAGGRMNRLIGDLVDVASIEAGKLAVTREVGDPTKVVAEAVDTIQTQAAASGVTLVGELVLPSSPASFDPARILQVLANLLSNAIKFTPAPGKVVARVERIADDIRFTVRDTGVGIPEDKLEAVFERFLQIDKSDRRGVGLGLFISKCIVQGHGGRIWAERNHGGGTTISFTIPLHAPA